jgi:hypothetical protein
MGIEGKNSGVRSCRSCRIQESEVRTQSAGDKDLSNVVTGNA